MINEFLFTEKILLRSQFSLKENSSYLIYLKKHNPFRKLYLWTF